MIYTVKAPDKCFDYGMVDTITLEHPLEVIAVVAELLRRSEEGEIVVSIKESDT